MVQWPEGNEDEDDSYDDDDDDDGDSCPVKCKHRKRSDTSKHSKQKIRSECSTHREEKESQVDDLVQELCEINSDKYDLSDPQYCLWAYMIVSGFNPVRTIHLRFL